MGVGACAEFKGAAFALCRTKQTYELCQRTVCCKLLKRGVGIPHGGLLRIGREGVEILVQEGLRKS